MTQHFNCLCRNKLPSPLTLLVIALIKKSQFICLFVYLFLNTRADLSITVLNAHSQQLSENDKGCSGQLFLVSEKPLICQKKHLFASVQSREDFVRQWFSTFLGYWTPCIFLKSSGTLTPDSLALLKHSRVQVRSRQLQKPPLAEVLQVQVNLKEVTGS